MIFTYMYMPYSLILVFRYDIQSFLFPEVFISSFFCYIHFYSFLVTHFLFFQPSFIELNSPLPWTFKRDWDFEMRFQQKRWAERTRNIAKTKEMKTFRYRYDKMTFSFVYVYLAKTSGYGARSKACSSSSSW